MQRYAEELMKTYRQWVRAGRRVCAGEKARAYLMDDAQVHGAALFAEDQTEQDTGADEQDTWTTVVETQEYQRIRAEARKLAARPKIKVGIGPNSVGVSVWCGPNKEAIGWLKAAGYKFNPKTHRWTHLQKDAEHVARGFDALPGYRVERDWNQQGPTI